jgi:cephalosporin-C deacetylase
MNKLFYFSLLLCILSLKSIAQPAKQLVTISITPDHKDWLYKSGEKVKFSVRVLKDSQLLKDIKINYTIGLEKMKATKTDSMVAFGGVAEINANGMTTPGFLRCTVTAVYENKTYSGISTAGFEPLKIKTFTESPADFVEFWNKAKADAAKIPMDAKLILLKNRCTENVDVYEVNLQNYLIGARLYGILCMPKKEGKYPALLEVPGAGIRPYKGNIAMAEKGIISLQIGIHGIPVTLEGTVYDDLRAGALKNYNTYGLDDKDQYYYKRVYLGCVRAIDYIFSLPNFDGEKLAVAGASQGGALTITTAALDNRVKFLVSTHPALCDLTAYANGRADGWPHMFTNSAYNTKPEKINTSKYYDVVNFARLIKIPGLYDWGFNDETCPPSSTYAAYNEITAPKKLSLYVETGHWLLPEQRKEINDWILNTFQIK